MKKIEKMADEIANKVTHGMTSMIDPELVKAGIIAGLTLAAEKCHAIAKANDEVDQIDFQQGAILCALGILGLIPKEPVNAP